MKYRLKKECWPDKKAGREYGGNAGLAFAMCEARKKRKNRQGGLKLFFVLMLFTSDLFFIGVHEIATLSLVTFHQGKVTKASPRPRAGLLTN
jgi:hypothetical protein